MYIDCGKDVIQFGKRNLALCSDELIVDATLDGLTSSSYECVNEGEFGITSLFLTVEFSRE